jgi:pyroglutamyl-peptidase
MTILVTAFENYDQWQENSSWLALSEYLREYGVSPDLITRRYPVNLPLMRQRLETDLARGVSGVIHLGQRPGASFVHLESICLNVAGVTRMPGSQYEPLIDGAPVAYRSSCPLGAWCERLSRAGVQAEVSYHAGTYLCNAIMYLSHAWFDQHDQNVPTTFVHLPISEGESKRLGKGDPSISAMKLGETVRVLIESMRTIVTHRVIA